MKSISTLFLIALLVGSNGCMTYSTVQDAKGHPSKALWVGCANEKDTPPKPAYYGFLLLTVPADIVTSPIQGICYLVFRYAPYHQ